MKAIRVNEFGGPEVLKVEEVPLAEPGSALAVNSTQRRLCVGCVSGAIEVFRVRDRVELHRTTGEVGAGGCTAERRLTLAPCSSSVCTMEVSLTVT